MSISVPRITPRLLMSGDPLFSLVRLISLGLILVVGARIDQHTVIPPTTPFGLIWWAYAIYGIAMASLAFVPRFRNLPSWIFIVDFGFIALFALFSGLPPALLVALIMLPTVWASTNRSPAQAVGTGVGAAVVYAGITLYRRFGDANNVGSEEMFVSIAVNCTALILVSWLVSTLSGQSSEINREHVIAARRDVDSAQRDAESYRDRMRALYEVAYKLSTTMNFQTVLDATVTESIRLINGRSSVVLLPTGEPDELYVAAGVGVGSGDLNLRIAIEPTGIMASILASGTPRILNDLRQSHALSSVPSMQNCACVCCVPLSAGRRNYGIVVVGVDRNEINEDELGMVSALANYAIIAMLNAQLVGELRDERTKLISKEEEVRQQLARDLHDGPAQSVAAITMNIEFVKRLLEREPSRVMQELTKMGELARRTTYDIRTLLFELRPLTLDSQGLVATLREYVTRFKDGPTQVLLEETVGELRLDAKREGTLFNIIQEASNNAMKHAQAKHIWIRLTRQGDELMATVQDDGKGFDLQAVRANYSKRGSFGLLNIDERARMVGGSAEMTSAVGAGTTVRVIVPLDASSI